MQSRQCGARSGSPQLTLALLNHIHLTLTIATATDHPLACKLLVAKIVIIIFTRIGTCLSSSDYHDKDQYTTILASIILTNGSCDPIVQYVASGAYNYGKARNQYIHTRCSPIVGSRKYSQVLCTFLLYHKFHQQVLLYYGYYILHTCLCFDTHFFNSVTYPNMSLFPIEKTIVFPWYWLSSTSVHTSAVNNTGGSRQRSWVHTVPGDCQSFPFCLRVYVFLTETKCLKVLK